MTSPTEMLFTQGNYGVFISQDDRVHTSIALTSLDLLIDSNVLEKDEHKALIQ